VLGKIRRAMEEDRTGARQESLQSSRWNVSRLPTSGRFSRELLEELFPQGRGRAWALARRA